MTEVVRFSQLGKQDLKIGTGTFEVRLGDGRVVTLDEIRLTDFLSVLTVGSVLFVKAGGVAGEDNSNLFWDDTNNRLGIGTASPSQPLHVVGVILGTQNLVFRSGTAFDGTLDHAITADRTYTFQDSSDTILGRATTDTLTNKTLLGTGTGNVIAGIIDRDVTTNDVVNTMTETTVYSFSVPGGTLGTANALRLTLIGDYLNNSGASTTDFEVKVNYPSAATVQSHLLSNITTGASRRGLLFEVVISAQNATNAQVNWGHLKMLAPGVAGAGTTIAFENLAMHNSMTVDSTANGALEVTFRHTEANANISARALAVQLEVLQ